MKKNKINFGILTAFVIIALLNQCQDARISRESKEAETIKISTVDVKIEDILIPPQQDNETNLEEYNIEDTCKTR